MADRLRRLALVNRHFHLSGSFERTTVLVARALVERGVEVHCYCDPATRAAGADGVVFHDVDPVVRSSHRLGAGAERAGFALAATQAVRRDRALFDLVDVNGTAAWEHDVLSVHEVAGAAARRWPQEAGSDVHAAALRARLAPVLQPCHGVDRAIQHRQLRPGGYLRLTASTDQVRDDLVRWFGVSVDDVDLLPPPLDLASFTAGNGSRAAVRRQLGIGGDRVLLFVGHSFARKGLGLAIRALAALPEDVQLVVVGDGGRDTEAFRSLAASAGVQRRVHFVGRTDEPARYYAAADAFVLPTRHDVWGTALVEAMAAGLPVVTTTFAGGAGAVAAARAGTLIDRQDPEALRAAIAPLLESPALRRELGERGRAAASAWGLDAHVALRLDSYERALAFRDAPGRRRVAALPAVQAMNPYQRLLYEALREEGFPLERGVRLSLRSLLRGRHGVAILHVHWPEHLYTFDRGPRALRPGLSWFKTAAFAVRLVAAHALRYRVVWTVHQVYPHRRVRTSRDAVAARVLAHAADAVIAHDRPTMNAVERELHIAPSHVDRIPHGSYVGVYPPGRPRKEVRAALGIDEGSFCFLCFGELRETKSVELVLDAFLAAPIESGVLVVAGHPKDKALASRLEGAAHVEPRVVLRLGYVDDAEVAELFAAADAAIVARDDGGTSGSLVLPLSLGVPVVVADRGAYREVIGDADAAWFYRAGDLGSLAAALVSAASDRADARRRGANALARAETLDWREIGRETAAVFRRTLERSTSRSNSTLN